MKERLTCILVALCACCAFSGGALASAKGIPRSLRGDGRITMFRPVTNERASFQYRNKKGQYDEAVLQKIDAFFHCRLTGEIHPIDPRLIEALDAIEDHFGQKEIRLISAYRSPSRNALMRRQGRGVAKKSLHMSGMAADIEIPGVSRNALRAFAAQLKQGGVGSYRHAGYVHVDTGDVRTWGFKPRAVPSRTVPAMSFK